MLRVRQEIEMSQLQPHRSQTRYHLACASVAVATLLVAAAGHDAVAQGRAAALVQQYAREHGFQVKQVNAGTANRPARRLFVPVTPQSFPSFLKKFNSNNGFCHLSFQSNHLVMGLKPPAQDGRATDCYLWARNYNGTVQGLSDCRNSYISGTRNNGYLIGVELPGNKLQHLSSWLQTRANPQDTVYRRGNCMEWLPNAEVGPNRPLFHDLGIRRSKDGRNMKAKLLHAGNNQVGVVGVYVPDANTFNTMNDQQLLGPPPAGGVADAMR
jgi:hypothetical protein